MSAIAIRPFNADTDKHFLYQTWLKNFKESQFARRITNDTYFKMQQCRIDNIMTRHDSRALIACSPDDEKLIFGFLVYEKTQSESLVHYAFTKSIYQRLGVFNMLMDHAGINQDKFVFTHWTRSVEDIFKDALGVGVIYNPYRV